MVADLKKAFGVRLQGNLQRCTIHNHHTAALRKYNCAYANVATRQSIRVSRNIFAAMTRDCIARLAFGVDGDGGGGGGSSYRQGSELVQFQE